jgi:hypothetical protein
MAKDGKQDERCGPSLEQPGTDNGQSCSVELPSAKNDEKHSANNNASDRSSVIPPLRSGIGESDKQEDSGGYDEKETDKVEFCGELTGRLAWLWVQLEEDKQDEEGYAAGWQVDEEAVRDHKALASATRGRTGKLAHHHRQLTLSVSAPPASGPMTLASPQVNPKTPANAARCSSVVISPMMT